MPTIQQQLPALPKFIGGETMENDIINALQTWQVGGASLFKNFYRGIDAELADSIFGHPNDEMCPLGFLHVWSEDGDIGTQGSPTLEGLVASVYVIFYIGVPATDPAFTGFVWARRAFIQQIFNALIFSQPGRAGNIPEQSRAYWWWDAERKRRIQYEAPFDHLGLTYTIDGEYNCTRIDFPVGVRAVS